MGGPAPSPSATRPPSWPPTAASPTTCSWAERPGADRTRLVWSLAAALHAEGIATLDLIGANTPSIAEYKRRLGAHLVPFVRATWHRPGVPRLVAAVRPLV